MKLTKDNIIEFLNSRLSNGVYVSRLITNNFYNYLVKPELTDDDFKTLISFMTTNGVIVKNSNGEYETSDGPEPTPPTPPVPTNRILYTVVEGGTQPTSNWITENCSDNVFDAETGEGYLELNEGVITIECPVGEGTWPNMFDDSGEDSNIATVVIPSQITSIGEDAFYECIGLTSVIIPNSVTSIGVYAFYECIGLTSVIIPNSVTSMGDNAFSGCTGLTSVTIPNSVTSIGDYAFSGCTGLTSVTIPNSVTNISSGVFSGCTGLTSVTIPNSVTSIGEYAFDGSGLTSVTIPNSVTNIKRGAFIGCISLASIIIPNSVTSIAAGAFEECSGLTSATIPNSLTSIEQGVFKDCASLASITIPNSVTSIDNYAFQGCTSLASVTCFATTPPTLGNVVFEDIATTDCIVPEGTESDYADSAWGSYFTTFNGQSSENGLPEIDPEPMEPKN